MGDIGSKIKTYKIPDYNVLTENPPNLFKISTNELDLLLSYYCRILKFEKYFKLLDKNIPKEIQNIIYKQLKELIPSILLFLEHQLLIQNNS